MIAAHLTPKDISLWKRLATMSTDQGQIRQAIYCFSQARPLLQLLARLFDTFAWGWRAGVGGSK